MSYRRFTYERVFNIGLILIAWTLYAVFFASQHYVRQVYSGRTPNFQNNLSVWLTCGYSWALLTYPILLLSRRFPFTREHWLRALAVHIPASLFFSIAVLAVFACFRIALGDTYSLARFENLVAEETHSGVLVYFGILGATYASRYFLARQANAHPQAPRMSVKGPAPDLERVEVPAQNGGSPQHAIEKKSSPDAPVFAERFSVKKGHRILFIGVDQIDSITSEGNYVKLRAEGESYLLRETMKSMEQKLDPRKFVRVRRSTILRIEQIRELRPISNGEFEVLLKSGTKLTSSRRYRKNLDVLLRA